MDAGRCDNNNKTRPTFSYNYSFVNHEDEIYFTYTEYDSVLTRFVVDYFWRFTWLSDDLQWKGSVPIPDSSCDPYGECGAYRKCDASDVSRFECGCLPGFEPSFPRAWYLRDWSGGCVRKRGESACDSEEEGS